ncbi:putative VQ motif-containing protein/13/19/31/33 [Dioscorea sansibarensis]
MAAATTTTKDQETSGNHGFTTYVQADPTSFRSLVQKLTGAPEGSPANLPVTNPPRRAPPHPDMSIPKRQRLQDRRQAPTKLELKLNPSSSSYSSTTPYTKLHHFICPSPFTPLVSPVSTMDFSSSLLSSPSTPSSTLSPIDQVEKAIAEKGFYLHPSPRNNGQHPPKLLHLFPLATSD